VTLEERAKYRLRYGIQFGPSIEDSVAVETNTAEPGATLDIQRRNLYGVGLVVGGGGVWSGEQYRIRGTASAPTFKGRVVSTTLTVEGANQDRDSTEYGVDIVDRSLRAILEQRWRVGRGRRIEFAYGLDINRRRVELTSTTGPPLPLRARFAGLNTTFLYDARDSLVNPRRGFFHISRVDVGAGLWLSDIAFARYQSQQFVYFNAGPLTLASALRFGTLDVDDEHEPAALLLFFKTGGSNSVRGYETDSLTPGYVLGLPAGGKVLLVMNQEVRVPVWRRIGAVGFFDAGNTFKDFSALDLGALKVGAGAGVRFETPVAVLRFDVGFPVPRLLGQPRARWYISIGQAF
jgi:outer membrane translocation and assembly module TamA